MYFFDKKVIYLVWKTEEGQARGVGTVRFLAMDGVCRIEIAVTKCGNMQGTYPIYLLSGDIRSLLGEITLNRGKGDYYIKCDTNALGDKAFPYTKVTGIEIDLKTEGALEQKWLPLVKEEEETIQSKESSKEVARSAEVSKEVTQSTKKPPEKQALEIYPNKWQQLCAIYPIVHPFEDGRAYLSIEPRDFVILQERYQPLVQNSFLLHSFYHYKYILLGRRKVGRNFEYYLGVPGVFYEKEKAAAIYYGFESFEGAVSPVTEGNFGYYMKRVHI